jgi:hypothetical protein
VLLRDVRNLHDHLLGTVQVEYLARDISRSGCRVWPVHSWAAQVSCRHPTARISSRPNPDGLATPENRPWFGLIETSAKRSRKRLAPRRTWPRCRRRTPSDATRVEAAVPLPRIGVVRIACADRNRADAHVIVKDVPAFLAGVCRTTTGGRSIRLAARSEIVESGHFLLMSSVDEQAAPHYLWID